MSEQAIHAGSDAIFASYHKMQERPEVQHKISEREKLARLANNENFRILKKIIDQRIQELTELTSINQGDTVESVGFRFLAAKIAKEYLEEIRDLPEKYRKFNKKD